MGQPQGPTARMGRTGDWPTIWHFENQHYFHQMGFLQPRLYHVSCEHFFGFDKTFQIIFNSGGTSNPMNGKQTWSTIRWSNHHHYCCQPFLVHLLWTTNNLHQMGFLRPRLPEDENGATSISLEYSLGMLFGQYHYQFCHHYHKLTIINLNFSWAQSWHALRSVYSLSILSPLSQITNFPMACSSVSLIIIICIIICYLVLCHIIWV